MASLMSLLEPSEDPKHSEIVRRLFSNLRSPNGFPNPGKDSQSVEWLIKMTEVPYEPEESQGLDVIEKLIQWPWGLQAFFVNEKAKDYLLKRQAKPQSVIVRQYAVVQRAVEMTAKT